MGYCFFAGLYTFYIQPLYRVQSPWPHSFSRMVFLVMMNDAVSFGLLFFSSPPTSFWTPWFPLRWTTAVCLQKGEKEKRGLELVHERTRRMQIFFIHSHCFISHPISFFCVSFTNLFVMVFRTGFLSSFVFKWIILTFFGILIPPCLRLESISRSNWVKNTYKLRNVWKPAF